MIQIFRTFALLTLGITLVFFSASCVRHGGPPPAHPVSVQTAVAVKMDTPLLLTGFGSTTERAGVDVVPQVSGTLLKRYFNDGAIVTNGQPLFLIDPADYELRVRQAESMLAADCANSELARLTRDRSRPLFEQKMISQEDFDTLQARLDAAVAQVKGDEAALDQARLNLVRCSINAPMDGICSKHFLDEGNLATAGMTRLTNLRSYNPITVDFALSEDNLSVIRRAMQTPPVRIEVTPRGDTNIYAGTLVFMDNAVNSQTGTIALRGEIPNAGLKLWADQFVDVRVFAGMEHDAIMVPEGAVQFGKMGTYLFAVSSTNTAVLRPVQTGVRYNDLIQILDGVAPGERVVVLGQFILYPGASVMDVSQTPLAAAAMPRPAQTQESSKKAAK